MNGKKNEKPESDYIYVEDPTFTVKQRIKSEKASI